MLSLLVFLATVQTFLGLPVPFERGTGEVAHFTKGNIIIQGKAGMGIFVVTPTAAGEYPVFLFATGFGGDAPSDGYSNYLSHIASYGYIVVSLDQLKYPEPSKYVDTMEKAIDWVEDNLGTLLKNNGHSGVTYNFDTAMAVGAQSSGNHMMVSYLNYTCGKAKAMVMVDPVDGADPFGINKNFIITPGTPVNFKIPTVLLDNGLDPKRQGIDPACAPEDLSNDRFYNAWNSPIWLINATEYGHLDCLDAGVARLGRLVCPSHGGDISPYQAQIGGLSVALLDTVFRKQYQYLDLLENASAMVVTSLLKNDLHGMDRTVTPYCIHA